MLPNTYMLGAPTDADNPFGNPMSATDLLKGLRMCNVNLHAPLPDAYGTWFPGKSAGMTSLWLGQPSMPESKKICAFHLGIIPEFTQVGPDGEILRRGWRAVLRKAIGARAVTKRAVNRVFKIDIDTDGDDPSCTHCRIEGRLTKADSAGNLCSLHANVKKDAARMVEARKESEWQASR